MVQWGGSPERRMDARWNFRWTYMLDGIFDGIFDVRNKKRYISLAMLLAFLVCIYWAGIAKRNNKRRIASDVPRSFSRVLKGQRTLHIKRIKRWSFRWKFRWTKQEAIYISLAMLLAFWVRWIFRWNFRWTKQEAIYR